MLELKVHLLLELHVKLSFAGCRSYCTVVVESSHQSHCCADLQTRSCNLSSCHRIDGDAARQVGRRRRETKSTRSTHEVLRTPYSLLNHDLVADLGAASCFVPSSRTIILLGIPDTMPARLPVDDRERADGVLCTRYAVLVHQDRGSFETSLNEHGTWDIGHGMGWDGMGYFTTLKLNLQANKSNFVTKKSHFQLPPFPIPHLFHPILISSPIQDGALTYIVILLVVSYLPSA
jgi:hypothetical protein